MKKERKKKGSRPQVESTWSREKAPFGGDEGYRKKKKERNPSGSPTSIYLFFLFLYNNC